MAANFAARLRELCDQKQSYAQVARDLGINRQQLSRYLSGSTTPREGLLRAFAEYFSVPVNQLFSETSVSGDARSRTVAALGSIFATADFRDIRPDELEEGFYRQYKHSILRPDKIFRSLILIKNDNGVFRYKMRTSKVYADILPGSAVDNVWEGVFFKQGKNLALIDKGSLFGDLAFHVLETRYFYDVDVKHGYHVNVEGFSPMNTSAARFVLQKIPKSDNIYKIAREQGFVEKEELPRGIAAFF